MVLTGDRPVDLLRERAGSLGLGRVIDVEPVTGGLAAEAALVRFGSGVEAFAKTMGAPPGDDVFEVEAEGLAALRAAGLRTPDVLGVGRDVLVLERLQTRRDDAEAWEQLAHDLAHLHRTTSLRFGWPRDGWLGSYRQANDWETDGHTFFARHRLLRWLPEPRLRTKLDAADRRALERLCDRLPELSPVRPASLTHGDLWAQNVMASPDGLPGSSTRRCRGPGRRST